MKIQTTKEGMDMKRKIMLTVAILTAVLLLLALASCGALKNNPTLLWLRVNRAMNKLDSYEIDTDMKMVFYVNGHPVTSKATGRTIEMDVGKKSQYFYDKTSTTITSSKLSINETINSIQAYHEGNYFLSNRGKNINQRLYSPMTLKEALAYREDTGLNLTEVFLDCEHAEVTSNDDGTKTLHYSGLKKEALEELAQSMGLEKDVLEYEIADMPVAITVDDDYRIQKMELSFTFDADEDALRVPTLSMVMTYSAYNAAEREVKSLNTENFVEVKDIRLLSQLEDMLKEREDENASFTLNTKQTTKIMGQSTHQKETDTVTYGVGDNGYFYEIKAEVNNAKYTISYQNGKQTVKGDGTNKSEKQTEKEAKDFVRGLINTANYHADYVTNITEVRDGVYEIVSDKPESTPYKNFFTNIGGTYTKATQTITITVEDGRITKIECQVKADGSITSGYNTYGVGLTIESTVTFE
jgi:hypothetical protein